MSNEKIKVLDDRAQSRDKVAIWFGSNENYMHLTRETVANSTDEIINNFEDGEITLTLHDDLETITVLDTGRGIPIYGKTDGIPNYQLLFQTLFAGTKYDSDETNTTGTNGVGMTVGNYTSTLFIVDSFREGKHHRVSFSDGGQNAKYELVGDIPEDKHGTQVTYKLDPDVYPVYRYNPAEIMKIVKSFAVSTSKVTLNFIHGDGKESFHYNSVEEYFDENVKDLTTKKILGKSTYKEDVVLSRVKDDDVIVKEITTIDVVLAASSEPFQETYLNLTVLPEQGTIHDGVLEGVRQFANEFAKDKKMFPKGTSQFSKSDIENSLSFVAVVFSNNVEFQNQTKLSTKKKLYRSTAKQHCYLLMKSLEAQEPKRAEAFIKHFLEIQKHNAANQRAQKQLKKKLTEKVEGISNRVDKLVDCEKHGPNSEVFVAEGDSAMGSVVLARDAEFQAAYALRGKILNCLKTDYSTIFSNQVITDLIKVLGCGIEGDKKHKEFSMFDIKSLRFGKIIIATDADADGLNIAALIITMFYRLMPTLLREGHIYIAKTPLYEVKLKNDKMIYYYTESEKDQKLPKQKDVVTVARVKGLGELDADVMAETAMDPETRIIDRVTVDDAEEMIKSIETWMGSNVDGRKEYIADNLNKYLDSVD